MNHMQWFIGCQFVSCQLQMQNGQNSNDIAACISVQVDMTKYSVHFYSALKQKWEWKIKYSRTHQLSILFKSQGIASTEMHRKTFVFRVVLWSFFFFLYFSLLFVWLSKPKTSTTEILRIQIVCAFLSLITWLEKETATNTVEYRKTQRMEQCTKTKCRGWFFSLLFSLYFRLNIYVKSIAKLLVKNSTFYFSPLKIQLRMKVKMTSIHRSHTAICSSIQMGFRCNRLFKMLNGL